MNTKANPADVATRSELWHQKQTLWFYGPDFLIQKEETWPCFIESQDEGVFFSAVEDLDVVDGPEMTSKGYEQDYEDMAQQADVIDDISPSLEFIVPSTENDIRK